MNYAERVFLTLSLKSTDGIIKLCIMRPFAEEQASGNKPSRWFGSSLKIRQPIGVGSWSSWICFGKLQKDEVIRTDVKLWWFRAI